MPVVFNSGGCGFKHRALLLFEDIYIQFKVLDPLKTFPKISTSSFRGGGGLIFRNMSLEKAKSLIFSPCYNMTIF